MFMTMDELRARRGVAFGPAMHLEVSHGCNISCEMCTFHDNVQKFGSMTKERIKNIDSGFERFGIIHIGDGSEPFINPDLLDIVSFLSKKGPKVSVQTNAKLIRKKEDAERIVDSGLNLLSISIDGVQDETLMRIRGGLSFEHISKAIDLINEAKQKLGSSTPYLASNAVAMRCNLDELPGLTKFLLDNKFSFFRIGFLELRKPNNNLAGELLIYDISKTFDILKQVRSTIESHPWPIVFDDGIFAVGMSGLRRDNCTAYKDRIYVNYAGDMLACYGKKNIGNIFNSSLDDLINSENYISYVDLVTTPDNQVCKDCTFCQIMSLDTIKDHFGREAIKHYSIDAINDSLKFAKDGGEPRLFWQAFSKSVK